MGQKQHFLSRLAEADRRETERRNVKLPGKVFYLKKGLRGYSSQDCMLLNISEGGSMIKLVAPSAVPEHFYLVIEGVQAKFPCVLMGKGGETVNLRFAQDLPTSFIDQLAKPRF
jgi:hypothetical protein